MTAVIIILALLCLLLLILVLPITVSLSYKQVLVYKIKYASIVLLDSEKRYIIDKIKRKKKKRKKQEPKSVDELSAQKEGFFKQQYKQRGFFGAVKYFSELLGVILKRLMYIIKHFKIRNFDLKLTVATDDAANTALEYGGVCCAVYPVLAFLQTNTDFKSKRIDVSTDFEKSEPSFEISLSVTSRLICFLIAAVTALIEFLKLTRKESENL